MKALFLIVLMASCILFSKSQIVQKKLLEIRNAQEIKHEPLNGHGETTIVGGELNTNNN